MSAIIDCASGGLDESDEDSDCSNASKWEFISPRLVNPTSSPVCLLWTKSSLMYISSSNIKTYLSLSSDWLRIAAEVAPYHD